jgi:hopanoid C-2 methylase
MTDGPLEDPALLGWPDIVVLTGLVTALDRMRHITAYARSRNPRIVVVGGGHAVRAFPRYCAQFLDYACHGDVEQIRDVVADAFGRSHAAPELLPRFDLAHWIGRVGYAESSRYCNFACSFCTLTAERRAYTTYPAEALRRQLLAGGRKRIVVMLDNNFYGNDRRSFAERLACLGELWRGGHFAGWTALVTNDFFLRGPNLTAARDAGCVALFTGVESFDTEWTRRQNKKQNGVRPQLDIIRGCLEAGVVFCYGLMLDLSTRSIAAARRELDLVLDNPEITLPAYVSLAIPLPGTPFFYDCLDRGAILPLTKIRDLESSTLSLRPVDDLPAAARFVRELQTMSGLRRRIVRHSAAFWRRYRRRFTRDQMLIALGNAAILAAPLGATAPFRMGARGLPRTHVSTTEPLDAFYRPAFRVDHRYEAHFQPTLLTDAAGRVSAALAPDVEAAAPRPRLTALTAGALRAGGEP